MWLIYLRFDDQGAVKAYHVRTDTKPEYRELLALAEKRGLSLTEKLVEYAVFGSRRQIKPKEAPNFHLYSGPEFVERWKKVEPA